MLPLPHSEKQYLAKCSTRQLLLCLSFLMGMKLCMSLTEEKSLPDRMLKGCLDLGGRRKLYNNEHHNLHSLFNINTMIK
jgi:hypothetical protein